VFTNQFGPPYEFCMHAQDLESFCIRIFFLIRLFLSQLIQDSWYYFFKHRSSVVVLQCPRLSSTFTVPPLSSVFEVDWWVNTISVFGSKMIRNRQQDTFKIWTYMVLFLKGPNFRIYYKMSEIVMPWFMSIVAFGIVECKVTRSFWTRINRSDIF